VVDGTNQVSNLVRHLAWQQTWPVARRRRNDVCHKSKFTTMMTTTVTSRRSVSHLPRYARTHAQADAQSENNASGGIHRTGGGITTVICNDEELDSSKHVDRKLGNIPHHSVSKFLGTEPSVPKQKNSH